MNNVGGNMSESNTKEKETFMIYRARVDRLTYHQSNGWIKAKRDQPSPEQLKGFEWNGSEYVDRGGMILMIIPKKEYEIKKEKKEKKTEERMKGVERKNAKIGFEKQNKWRKP